MAQKIRSIELENGVIATFLNGGMIEISQSDKEVTNKVTIRATDLKLIKDTSNRNSKIEAGSNGTLTVNKEAEKS